MTEKDKELLLKDLCARLPYGVVLRCMNSDTDYKCFLTTDILHSIQNGHEHYDYKPYLRSMSSMTEDEVNQYYKIRTGEDRYKSLGELDAELFDLYHKNHIDYRGLIEKGLALEALEGMYKNG